MHSIDEKEFLEGYLSFTSELRVKLIKLLSVNLASAKNLQGKQCYYILALEQLFLIYETFEGFFIAIRERNKKSLFKSLEKNLNIQNLGMSLRKKDEEKIIKELNFNLEQFNIQQQEIIKKKLSKIAGMWQDEKFLDAMRYIFIPMFYKIKHKLQLYRKGNEIIFALDEKEEKKAREILKKYNIKSQTNISSLNLIVEIAERYTVAIKDLISIRLIELGDSLNRIIKLTSASWT